MYTMLGSGDRQEYMMVGPRKRDRFKPDDDDDDDDHESPDRLVCGVGVSIIPSSERDANIHNDRSIII